MREIFKVSRRTLYILVGAIAVILLAIGIGVAVFWPSITSATASQTGTPTPIVSVTGTAKPTVAKILKQYAPDIKNQIAQGLHLTPDQLKTQLQAGKTLSDIATTQKISASQLQTVVGNALQTGLQPAVTDGTLTQRQLDKLVKRYQNNPNLLDHLLGGKAAK
jgi:flagellar basal body-associated protein FliL